MTQFRKCYFGKETLQTIVDSFEHVSQTNTVNSFSLPMWPGAPKKPCSMLHSKWKTWADSWKPHRRPKQGGSAVERLRVPRYQTSDTVGPKNPAPVWHGGSSGGWSSRHADSMGFSHFDSGCHGLSLFCHMQKVDGLPYLYAFTFKWILGFCKCQV